VPTPLYADFSDARPSPASIKAAGYTGVIRYGSRTPAKNLTRAERQSYIDAGLDVLGVWETTGTDALSGAPAGSADAVAAEVFFATCGYPTDAAHPILYAIDFGATAQQDVPVEEYFEAIEGTSSRSHGWGPYGSLSVCAAVAAAVPGAAGYWQTAAWSSGKVWAGANLYQRVTPTLIIPGASYDENVLLIPFTGPAPFPPGPIVTTGETDMNLAAFDPTSGGFWATDANGDLYCPPSGSGPTEVVAPFIAGLNQHPEYHAGELESAGQNPCVGIVAFKDHNGQIGICYITQPKAGGTLGTPYAFYRFARNGQPD
jgi:hypothetical protein